MNEPSFRIDNICTERQLNGRTIIDAVCIKDQIKVQLKISNLSLSEKEQIKRLLILKYNEILESERIKRTTLMVGEIL